MALQSCFKDKRFGDSKKRLVIPSYNLVADYVYIFRTPHSKNLRRDYRLPAWKVALATSSAPTFFSCTREVDNTRLIDGGVWANNPTMISITEALGTLGIKLSSLWVFSIGTSDAVTQRPKRLNSGGIIAWALKNAAIDVIMRAQSIGTNNQATFLLGRDRIERLNPIVAADEFSLDGIHKVEDLIGRAAHHSRVFIPTFEKKFATHFAATYKPIYT